MVIIYFNAQRCKGCLICTNFLGWDLLGNIVISRIIIIRYGCIVFLGLRSSANKLEILKKIVIWIDRNGPTLKASLDEGVGGRRKSGGEYSRNC